MRRSWRSCRRACSSAMVSSPCSPFTLITERALICVISITYDREEAGEDQRARACFEQLQAELAANGLLLLPAGNPIHGADERSGSVCRLAQDIKRAVDPAGILAPGRYAPGGTGPARAEIDAASRQSQSLSPR